MKIKSAVCSSVGMKRKSNQDNFYINGLINSKAKTFILKSFLSSSKEQLFCVCDGMGGEEKGEVASLLAALKIASYDDRYDRIIDEFDRHIEVLTQSANKAICEYMSENGIDSMGSTLAVLCVAPDGKEAVAANVGDSKIYLFRNGLLVKLSEDHNAAQRLVDLGVISEQEARTHKEKSQLTQHLGISPDEMIIEPSISDSILLNTDDIFLICSDGLTDMLENGEITDILSQKVSVKEQCKALVDKANSKGGNDNITVIICKVV